MKIGLLYEMEMLKPWGPNAEINTCREAVEQIEAADRCAFHTVRESSIIF